MSAVYVSLRNVTWSQLKRIQLTKELIINAAPQGVEIALLEDKKLVELHYGRGQDQFAVGDLYLGKVKN